MLNTMFVLNYHETDEMMLRIPKAVMQASYFHTKEVIRKMPLVFMFKMSVINQEFLKDVIFTIYNMRYKYIVKRMNFRKIDNAKRAEFS